MPPTAPTPPAQPPLRKAAQSLRWFVRAFEDQTRRLEAETGLGFSVDRGDLAAVFAAWRKDFDAQKPSDARDYPAYVGFAAGLMLRTLLRLKPASVVEKPAGADVTNPAYFWPEGYLYVVFCLNVRGLVLEKDFHGAQSPHADLDDVRTWWSFKENVSEDGAMAIAFLEHFAGETPEWTMPEIFRPDRTRAIARQFFDAKVLPLAEADDNG